MAKTKKQRAAHAAAQRRYYRRSQLKKITAELESQIEGMHKADVTILDESDKAEYQKALERRIKALEKAENLKDKTPTITQIGALRKASEVTNLDEALNEYYEILSLFREARADIPSDRIQQDWHGRHKLKSAIAQSLVDKNLERVENIIRSAREELGVRDLVDKLKAVFPVNTVRYELERLIYAMYDKQYSAWGGHGFDAKLAELEAELA